MAGDWIKIEKSLMDKPEARKLARLLGVSRFDAVGRLLAFWGWVDSVSHDGFLDSSCEDIDDIVDLRGFAEALRQVGWLQGRDAALQLPNFDRHLGHSAKARALEAEAKRLRRAMSDTNSDKCRTNVRPEKRREENTNTPPYPPQAGGEGEICLEIGANAPPPAEGGGELRPDAGADEPQSLPQASPEQVLAAIHGFGTIGPMLDAGLPTPGAESAGNHGLAARATQTHGLAARATGGRATRQRDPLFDALAGETNGPGVLTKKALKAVGVALAEIREASPGVTEEEIRRRAEKYRRHWPNVTLTANALAKHWATFEERSPPKPAAPPEIPEPAGDWRGEIARTKYGPGEIWDHSGKPWKTLPRDVQEFAVRELRGG